LERTRGFTIFDWRLIGQNQYRAGEPRPYRRQGQEVIDMKKNNNKARRKTARGDCHVAKNAPRNDKTAKKGAQPCAPTGRNDRDEKGRGNPAPTGGNEKVGRAPVTHVTGVADGGMSPA